MPTMSKSHRRLLPVHTGVIRARVDGKPAGNRLLSRPQAASEEMF
jgi:hypothetical protein